MLQADLDLLFGLIPSLAGLGRASRDQVLTRGQVMEVDAGTKLTQAGEVGDLAYFILSGKAVAGILSRQGEYHSLSVMEAGDIIGEIAALTGARRTADVVTEEPARLLKIPASVLRSLMSEPDFSRMVLTRMSERLARNSIHDLPRLAGVNPQDARELREAPSA